MIRPLFLAVVSVSFCLNAATLENTELQHYFESKVQQISSNCLAGIETRDQWEKLRPKYREQLFEMLSLSPLPGKTDLHPVVTGKVERDDFLVEKLHFQSMPGLYVTANLYLPKNIPGPLPTILYVCGHGAVKENGISYGNKVAYQHHGAWFARNGYACLIIDTIQLGEIEGLHHGTYREGMWWWNSHGYTPAGVEAWNCIRALDYLETRPEVDKTRFGVTGRSGGGAYSWWITALDDRIKVAAPVAGITDLRNYVSDGAVEGHCDCMFFVNTYRWDYPMVAALAAPRPLLICNSDKDTIFPLDGVLRTHAKTKKIYSLYGASNNLGLLITEGPHKDTQDLQVPVFRWFNRFLKHEDPVIEMAATKFFTPQELKVFDKLPEDERTSRIHETFVTRTPIAEADALKSAFRAKSFDSWPSSRDVQLSEEKHWTARSREVRLLRFNSEENVRLAMFYSPVERAEEIRLCVLTADDMPALQKVLQKELGSVAPEATNTSGESVDWLRPLMHSTDRVTFAFLLVRGEGSNDPKRFIQIRRRYMLIGETLDGMRVSDISAGVDLLRSFPENRELRLEVCARGKTAANAVMYAFLAKDPPQRLKLLDFPENETEQPDYLNAWRFASLSDVLKTYLSRAIEPRNKNAVNPRESTAP
jgi:dienelactone hydrolase